MLMKQPLKVNIVYQWTLQSGPMRGYVFVTPEGFDNEDDLSLECPGYDGHFGHSILWIGPRPALTSLINAR